MLAQGRGEPAKDEVEVRRLLGLAAAQGHGDSQYNLGRMLAQGLGEPKDEVEARRQYTLATAQGHASAQSGLGIMLLQGLGGPKDEAEARRQFTLAAVQGHPLAVGKLAALTQLLSVPCLSSLRVQSRPGLFVCLRFVCVCVSMQLYQDPTSGDVRIQYRFVGHACPQRTE